MSDLDRLREALEWAERFPHARMGIETRPILAAARRFLALTETGQKVEWCVNHNLPALPDKPTACFDEGVVWETAIAPPHGLASCRIVERLLVAPSPESRGFRYSCGDFGDWRTGPVSDGGSET